MEHFMLIKKLYISFIFTKFLREHKMAINNDKCMNLEGKRNFLGLKLSKTIQGFLNSANKIFKTNEILLFLIFEVTVLL